ncbi:MAG TPA: matrixin family metalloprotease, partial [Gemmatimonadaceae bacterium]|nr:matrixin family metalloprotease [Gemmatimonadaceae bacterium]
EGELLDEDSMRAMAMHEIGHLLGLDHTSDELSIMAPKVRVRELSDADRATVRLLYSLPAGSFR